jgi:hypothetical protein
MVAWLMTTNKSQLFEWKGQWLSRSLRYVNVWSGGNAKQQPLWYKSRALPLNQTAPCSDHGLQSDWVTRMPFDCLGLGRRWTDFRRSVNLDEEKIAALLSLICHWSLAFHSIMNLDNKVIYGPRPQKCLLTSTNLSIKLLYPKKGKPEYMWLCEAAFFPKTCNL